MTNATKEPEKELSNSDAFIHSGQPRKKRKVRKLVLFVLGLVACVLALCLEYYDAVNSTRVALTLGIFCSTGILVPTFIAVVSKDGQSDIPVSDESDVVEHFKVGGRNFFRRVYKSTPCFFWVVVLLYFSCVSFFAAFHGYGYILIRAQETVNITHGIIATLVKPLIKDETECNDEIVTDEVVVTEETSYLRLLDPDRLIWLSNNDSAILYFEGKLDMYTNNQQDINNMVYDYIISLQLQERCNLFDDYAPNEVQDEICALSETVVTDSDTLDLVIEYRSLYYKDYPKEQLARLIAENYARYGKAYYDTKGHEETVEYYFGNAIFWYNEALCYQNDPNLTRSLLHRIAIRYHDIADYLSNDTEKERATSLYTAYDYWSKNI